ncbi:hypothetical protein [Clostridium tyrobutyricum]
MEDRNLARKSKNWVEADTIRDKLNSMNIELIDLKDGTKWRIKN